MKKLIVFIFILSMISCSPEDEKNCDIYNVGGTGSDAQVLVKNNSSDLIIFTIESDVHRFPGSGVSPGGSASFGVRSGSSKYTVINKTNGDIYEGILEVETCNTTIFNHN